ncbi:hypothetical protein KML24007_08790 [Alistipes indistinctus]|uniref:pyocin knob domain-containing protein n=1 Tax=Alistipes indistinctus TaxID=626932 RepID=UPI0036F2099E
MTIIQSPATYNFAGNIPDLIVDTTEQLSFTLSRGGTQIVAETYTPAQNDRIVINLRNLLELLVEVPGYEEVATPIAQYTYTLGSTTGTFYCLPGGHGAAVSAESFLRGNFLTWQPQTRVTLYHTPHRLRYAALAACVCKVKGYFTDGTSAVISLLTMSAGNIYTMDVSFGTIRGKFDTQPTYYDVWVENTTGQAMTWGQRYMLADFEAGTNDYFIFANSLGGFDTIRFSGDRKEINKLESVNAIFDDQTLEYDIDRTRSWKKYTGYIADEQLRMWVLDFFNSPQRYHLTDSGALQRIYVSEPKLEDTAGEAAGYEFTYAYSRQSRYINLERAETPQLLEITDPASEVFFLAPRLNQFEAADPASSADYLIPIQAAAADKWLAISLASLLDYIKPTGIDVDALQDYLTDHKYATQAWVSQQNFLTTAALDNYLLKSVWDEVFEITTENGVRVLNVKLDIAGLKGITAYADGSLSGSGASGSLGELVNVGQWADAVPTADRVMVQLAGATHWSAKPLADLVGLDTAALAQYLTANSYLKASDISSYLTWANLSGKPTVYPTSWELVVGRPTKLSDLTDDVVAGNYLPKSTWDAVFEVVTVDGTPALKVKYDILGLKGISAYGLGSTSGGSASGSLGELVNVGQWADAVPTADRVMVQLAGATHWSAKPLADLVGLDTAALAQYLTANSYLKASDISSYLTWANLSGKPTVYPTSWELVTGRPTKLSDLTDDVVSGNYLPKPTWDAVFEVVTVDGTPALKVKYDILGLKGITAYADGSLSGGFSGALVDLVDVAVTNLASGDILKYNGTHFVNVPVSSIAGASSWDQITGKPDYFPTRWADVSGAPTSFPASDVYPWAKAASKPTYTAAEVGAVALNGGGDVSGSINASAYLTANTLRAKAALYPTISFVKTNDNSESLLIVAGNNLYYRPVASDATNRLVYHSGNFNPSSKLDKSVWDEAFELKTVNGVRVISAKLDFLSVAGISAYATGPSSGGGGGGLDYDLLKQALTGAITPDGYPFTISASFLGAIDKTYLTGKLANTYANKVHTHLWTDITDRPTSLPANGGNADTVDNLHGSSFAQIKSYTYPDGGINNITDLDFTGNIQAHFPGHEYSCIWQGKDFRGVIFQLKLKDYYTQSMMYRGGETKTWMTVWDSGNFNPANKFGFSADQLSDLNNAPNNAFFVGAYNATNSPVQNSWSNGFTIAYGNNTDFKKQFCYAGEKWWTRGRTGTTWSAWAQIWDSGNFNPDNYLPLSGGSITGGLGVSGYLTAGVLRVKATSYPQISFVNTTTNRDSLLFVNGSELYWRPTAGTATDYKVYHSGSFNPGNYLLLSGGTMTGDITFGSNGSVRFSPDKGNIAGVMNLSNTSTPATVIGTDVRPLILLSSEEIYRSAPGGIRKSYKIYDSSNSNLSTIDWSANNLNAAANLDVAGQAYVSGWLRSRGNVGWYSQDYGGGIHMTDSTWVRVYGSKGLMIDTGTSPINMGQLQITCSAEASIGFRSASNGNWCLGKGVKSIGSGFGLYNAVTNRTAFQIDSATDNASFVGSITAPTFVGNLSGSASSVNGYDINSFTGYYKYTIDASSLDQNTYYPVTMYLGNHHTVRISVIVALDSGTKPAWSSHASGYSVRFIEEVNGSGWGTSEVSRNILANEYRFANANPVGRVEQMTNSSTEVIWVRGGGKYFFYLSIPYITPALRTSTFTNASQSVSPRTDTMDLRMAANGNGIAASKLYAHNSIEINGFTIDVYNGALRVNGNLVATGGVTAYQ